MSSFIKLFVLLLSNIILTSAQMLCMPDPICNAPLVATDDPDCDGIEGNFCPPKQESEPTYCMFSECPTPKVCSCPDNTYRFGNQCITWSVCQRVMSNKCENGFVFGKVEKEANKYCVVDNQSVVTQVVYPPETHACSCGPNYRIITAANQDYCITLASCETIRRAIINGQPRNVTNLEIANPSLDQIAHQDEPTYFVNQIPLAVIIVVVAGVLVASVIVLRKIRNSRTRSDESYSYISL